MDTDKPGEACGSLIVGLLLLAGAYIVGLDFLGDERQWWHYLIALPLGLLWLWLVYWGGLGAILKWIGVSGAGIFVAGLACAKGAVPLADGSRCWILGPWDILRGAGETWDVSSLGV